MFQTSMTIATSNTTTAGREAIRELSSSVGHVIDGLDILHRPEDLINLLLEASYFHAAVAVVVGALCVLNGYNWHRWVVILLAFAGGWFIGRSLGDHLGETTIVGLSIGLLCAVVSKPLLKLMVAVFAGITGAYIGANIWTAVEGAPQDLHWAGAGMGFIALAMASLILFRAVIVLFTSVGGASLVVFGLLTIMLHVPQWEPVIRGNLAENQMLIPLLVGIAALGGFVLQEGRLREAAAEET